MRAFKPPKKWSHENLQYFFIQYNNLNKSKIFTQYKNIQYDLLRRPFASVVQRVWSLQIPIQIWIYLIIKPPAHCSARACTLSKCWWHRPQRQKPLHTVVWFFHADNVPKCAAVGRRPLLIRHILEPLPLSTDQELFLS